MKIITLIIALACMATANATERILTSTTGQTTQFRLIERTEDNIVAIRKSDAQRFVIPIKSLSKTDQQFLATWQPPPNDSYQPSSVSRAGSPTLQRESYPSKYQPRYSPGSRGGYGVTRSSGGGCRFTGSATTTKPGCP